MKVQAVLFDARTWSTTQAREWLDKHGYERIKRVHHTEKYLRYRIIQTVPGTKYRIKHLGKGVSFILEIS
jgi:hypothetical protein